MKKYILLFTILFSSYSFFPNTVHFFDFKAEEPEMVVSALKGMMETGGQRILKDQSLYLHINLTALIKQLILFNFVFQMRLRFAAFQTLGLCPL